MIDGDTEMVHGPEYNNGLNMGTLENIDQSQKNGQRAGAAMQARLGL